MLFVLLAACTPTPSIVEGDVAAQLERATVATEVCAEPGLCVGDAIATGALSVEGAERDLVLGVGDVAISVHSPTLAPLADYAGREVSAHVSYDYFSAPSLALEDAEGLLHVSETGAGDGFEAFDVSYGEALAETTTSDDWVLTFRTVIVQTDDGPVELAPGDVAGIVVDGVAWRFAVVAAYEVGTLPDGEYPDCGGMSPMLSYEATRVEAEVPSVRLLRPEGMDMASFSGCGG